MTLLLYGLALLAVAVVTFLPAIVHAERNAPRRPYLNDPYARAEGRRIAEEMGVAFEPSPAQIAFAAGETKALDAAAERAWKREREHQLAAIAAVAPFRASREPREERP
jgi:hypothetical protein